MSGGWTPFPNVLLDEVMPRLRDTEFRVLCVLVRETIGRRDTNGNRQRRVWLSQSLLMRKTGRAGEAVSRAIEVLCLSGLIEIQDAVGRPLTSSKARRAFRGSVYYSLHPSIQAEISEKRTRKSE